MSDATTTTPQTNAVEDLARAVDSLRYVKQAGTSDLGSCYERGGFNSAVAKAVALIRASPLAAIAAGNAKLAAWTDWPTEPGAYYARTRGLAWDGLTVRFLFIEADFGFEMPGISRHVLCGGVLEFAPVPSPSEAAK